MYILISIDCSKYYIGYRYFVNHKCEHKSNCSTYSYLSTTNQESLLIKNVNSVLTKSSYKKIVFWNLFGSIIILKTKSY